MIPYDALHSLNCDVFYTQWWPATGRPELQPEPEKKPSGLRLVKT